VGNLGGGHVGKGLQHLSAFKEVVVLTTYNVLQAIDTSCHLCCDFRYSLKKKKEKKKSKT